MTPAPCPACGKEPTVAYHTASTHPWSAYHFCYEIPNFYLELKYDYMTQDLAIEAWNLVIKSMAHKLNPEWKDAPIGIKGGVFGESESV